MQNPLKSETHASIICIIISLHLGLKPERLALAPIVAGAQTNSTMLARTLLQRAALAARLGQPGAPRPLVWRHLGKPHELDMTSMSLRHQHATTSIWPPPLPVQALSPTTVWLPSSCANQCLAPQGAAPCCAASPLTCMTTSSRSSRTSQRSRCRNPLQRYVYTASSLDTLRVSQACLPDKAAKCRGTAT